MVLRERVLAGPLTTYVEVTELLAVLALATYIALLTYSPLRSTDLGSPRTAAVNVTVIVPIYRDSHLVRKFFRGLKRLKYPKEKLQVIAVLERGDEETLREVEEVRDELGVEVIFNDSGVRSKPAALNQALKAARGDVVAIYDVDDEPHPEQPLAAVNLISGGVDVVQFRRVAKPLSSSYLERGQEAEFLVWHGAVQNALASITGTPAIAGTSYYIRRELIELVGGWNPRAPAEDLDLTYELVARRAKVAISDPPSVTLPVRGLKNLLTQRSRWVRGAILATPKALRSARSLPLALITAGLSLVTVAALTWLAIGAAAPQALRDVPVPLTLTVTALMPASFIATAVVLARLGRRGLSTALSIAVLTGVNALATILAMYELITKPHEWSKAASQSSSTYTASYGKPSYAGAGLRVMA